MKSYIETIIEQQLAEHNKAIVSVKQQLSSLNNLCVKIEKSLLNNGKIIWFGNGGSAADAQHLAAEFMVRYKKNRSPLASIALTTDTSILTAHANDFKFETVFSRQLQAIANANDVVVGISTSGNSENILLALQIAKQIQCYCYGFLGNSGGKIKDVVDDGLIVDSTKTASIQEAHIFAGHLICEHIDRVFN